MTLTEPARVSGMAHASLAIRLNCEVILRERFKANSPPNGLTREDGPPNWSYCRKFGAVASENCVLMVECDRVGLVECELAAPATTWPVEREEYAGSRQNKEIGERASGRCEVCPAGTVRTAQRRGECAPPAADVSCRGGHDRVWERRGY